MVFASNFLPRVPIESRNFFEPSFCQRSRPLRVLIISHFPLHIAYRLLWYPLKFSLHIDDDEIIPFNMMKKYFSEILLVFVPCASSFIVANTKDIFTAVRQSASAPQPQPLFVHVNQIHDHRDALVKLDDPLMIMRNDSVKKDESLRRLTKNIAPIALALYLIGHFLNTYHTTPMTDGRVNIDPILCCGILIGAGFYLLFKSSVDATFLSPT